MGLETQPEQPADGFSSAETNWQWRGKRHAEEEEEVYRRLPSRARRNLEAARPSVANGAKR
jgi:ROKNT (NUC014) domain